MASVSVDIETDELLTLAKSYDDFSLDLGRKELPKLAKKIQPTILELFGRTTKTWRHQPDVKSEIKSKSSETTIITGTSDDVWNWLNWGTEPHIIRIRNASRLSFLSGYSAKTTPFKIDSGAGGASGNRVYAIEVHHPGFPPRRFDLAMDKILDSTIPEVVEKFIAQEMRRRFS